MITILSFSVFVAEAQIVEINTKVEATGLMAINDSLPFWMHSNTNGELADETNLSLSLNTKLDYAFNESNTFGIGVGFFLRDGVEDNLQRDEIYLEYANKWIDAVLGSKNPRKKFQGLAVVDDNFLLSGNSRALTGILVQAPQFLKLTKSIFIDYGLANYFLNDDRVVQDVMVHYKRLGVKFKVNSRSSFTSGLEHYAQWGGYSEEYGQQPDGFNDFIDIFFARGASDENADPGERVNALGNHLGQYNLQYDYMKANSTFSIYHKHPFEDGSGSAFKNFPDGIWGVYFEPDTVDYTSFLKGILFEYVQTTDQSNSNSAAGNDDYFNSGIYSSGWTYENRVIGIPLFKTSNTTPGIINNRVQSFHFGLLASVKEWEFFTKLTYSNNYGTYTSPYLLKESTLYTCLKTKYSTNNLGSITLQLGYDYSNINDYKFGTGLSYLYSF